jgi:hypothetical protein
MAEPRYDSVVSAIVQKFLDRARVGQEKYGTTLDRSDLTTLQWITHAQEELMDGILYLEKLKQLFSPTPSSETANR